MPTPISGHTALAGVLGDPVRHSLSPAMHNAALAELGLDWVYLALPAPAEELETVVRGLEALDCRGLNVTLPHKQAVARLCRSLSPLAERVGAVNTLVRHPEGGWLGDNTDVTGFLAPLRASGSSWHGRRAVVLGCGGSARAVVAALVELGCGAITVAGRSSARLEGLLSPCRSWAPQVQGLAWDSQTESLQHALAQADLVVNTTPVGMASATNPEAAQQSPLTLAELETLRPGSTVYDLIYTPRPTALLQAASARGCQSLDGLEMLVQQGAAALRLWSGLETVPVAAMRAAALAQLGGGNSRP
ncbi:shikimate dehydrogenase [Cyanobium sp. Alchichica 3B3-8F6]|uniref:shikimate dehydrogenase n=1 Tax=Cyanobium sp. Alchichica 3B3-8F6 TaxID=2823696 RepID=UPI0020CF5234|nr:shikimate dehydrogenase [Cyanobium sp. Alchichica 3B3-8F6]MCP9881614.1 shikimate dehydrogenase [Cyanobium sp. Alchichica 3B3-8F6]